jgi:hypothetical protein
MITNNNLSLRCVFVATYIADLSAVTNYYENCGGFTFSAFMEP